MDTDKLGLRLFFMGENSLFINILMSDSFYKNPQGIDSGIDFGRIIADTSGMADNRDIQSNLWDRYNASMDSFYRSILSSNLFNYTTPNKNSMYSLPLFAKISLILAAWWEAFMVHNIVVQWIVSVFVLLGSVIWLMTYWLSYQKKNLILSNIKNEEKERFLKIATGKQTQADINKIIIRSLIIAIILVTLVLFNSKL